MPSLGGGGVPFHRFGLKLKPKRAFGICDLLGVCRFRGMFGIVAGLTFYGAPLLFPLLGCFLIPETYRIYYRILYWRGDSTKFRASVPADFEPDERFSRCVERTLSTQPNGRTLEAGGKESESWR